MKKLKPKDRAKYEREMENQRYDIMIDGMGGAE
jgi:hypothetical protein